MSRLFKDLFVKVQGFKVWSNGGVNFRSISSFQNNTKIDSGEVRKSHSVAYQIDDSKSKLFSKDIISKVNEQVVKREQGRLFAIVHVAGKQFKITEGDVIVIEGYWPPDVGDKINFEKIMLIAGIDFSLIGSPLVERGLANVTGTVIEKTVSHTKTHFRKKRRKQYKRINFYRVQQTMVRINDVKIVGSLNNPPDVVQGPTKTLKNK